MTNFNKNMKLRFKSCDDEEAKLYRANQARTWMERISRINSCGPLTLLFSTEKNRSGYVKLISPFSGATFRIEFLSLVFCIIYFPSSNESKIPFYLLFASLQMIKQNFSSVFRLNRCCRGDLFRLYRRVCARRLFTSDSSVFVSILEE